MPLLLAIFFYYFPSKILTYNEEKNQNITQTNLLKTNTIDSHLRGYRMSALFQDLARTVLFLSSSPHTFRLRMISSMVVFILWWGFPHTSLLCLLMLLLGLNFLQQPLQANTLPLWCQILCWLGICKELKALSQTLQGWTLSLSCPPTLIPSSDNIISLTNLPSTPADPVASRWAPLFMCPLKLILVLKMM